MKVEIIAVGTELLMGQVIDSNSATIAQELLSLGLGVYYRQVVGDNPERMFEAIQLAGGRSDLIILCGGIGPTQDDITKQMVAKYLNVDLIHDQEEIDKIKRYFEKSRRSMPQNNLRQALMFKGGVKLENPVGTAAGALYKTNNDQMFAVLPGPPMELKATLKQSLIPYLLQFVRKNEVIDSVYLNFVNIGESQVAEDIEDLINQQTNPSIAMYAKPERVQIRLTSNAKNHEEAEKLNEQLAKEIIKRLSKHFIGRGKEFDFAKEVVTLLKERSLTLSCAESLTGGLFASEIVSQSGASTVFKGGVVSYTPDIKEQLLNVSPQTIKEHSVYSQQVAIEMAKGAQEQLKTDVSVSFTGVAGPDDEKDHPVGEVHYAIAFKNEKAHTGCLHLGHRSRNMIRYLSVQRVLANLIELLRQR
ncbi:competence/damage-inducible protein A [Dolosicoccus paucivorans]|uniref:Putative competence-damage inducible protein n=1 Tax=Dolosicoccus paucivorans TaxID=84521 RepID=A0A1G8PM31_9LACT|nr:competence/damage-inducible protein A [Dolosicoccus paucivorans]PMB83658.1 competence/damage-inducible protein A [Dolosicoccus paucivorans]PMC57790.1 competence/damage-inducible protein A [Dolosicoccus paucivorans]SDI93543.1 nicotinamide-nucleotide amidase [Dolosicoccus paucivorans]